MKRLPLAALKFEAVLGPLDPDDPQQFLSLRLRYYLVDGANEVTLVHITLTDTAPFDPLGGPLFWFHYTPVQRNSGTATPLTAMYPQIDIAVFSSIDVSIYRHVRDLDHYQALGFVDAAPETLLRDALFTPVRPKISLRRVQAKAQLPPLGSAANLALANTPFSFYVDARRQPQFTTDGTLHQHLRSQAASSETESPSDAEVLLPRRTWTQIFTEEQYTEFTFVESSYSLRVYDQYFDEIDGKTVQHDDVALGNENAEKLSDSFTRLHTAAQLRSKPKYFDFSLQFDPYAKLAADGYQLPYRTRLDIRKSANVLLTGTLVRHTDFDNRTQRIRKAASPRPAQLTRTPGYQDFLPWIHLREWQSGQHLPLGDLEKSAPAAAYEFHKSAHRRFLEFQFSMTLGFTPVVGEAYGLYELYLALCHAEDPFGNKLSDTEKVIVAIATILPFVGSGILREGATKLSALEFPLLRRVQQSMARELATLKAMYR